MTGAKDTPKKLPKGWRWVKLEEVCKINPSRPKIDRPDDAPTTFIPMEAVDAVSGVVTGSRLRPFGEVKKGYTYFGEGDVLFAKITPCMQNGKHAIAKDLLDGIGFGTTEFHVLSPGPNVMADWVHSFLRQPAVLEKATEQFTGAVGQQRVPADYLANLEIQLPPLPEQKRIAAILNAQMAALERARKAGEEQKNATDLYPFSLVRESLEKSRSRRLPLGDCLDEIRNGVASEWSKYPVLGATRQGLALAKDPVGKHPERYKPVMRGTIFYNPMRILLGSISMVDEADEPGITSPDYVVIRGKEGVLDSRWFYYWFRSPFGAHLIESLSRGAVRERILFNSLAEGMIEVPSIAVQREASAKMRQIPSIKGMIEAQSENINALPAVLLRRAFAGEL